MEEDRISQLPEQILHHHILSRLPQEQAVGTCVLSKSWRHLGPTRPKLEFREFYFRERKDKFIFAVEEALERYVDQNLSIQDLIFNLRLENDALLNKWIPKVILNMGVKTFDLRANDYSLPFVVFQAEFLEELYLKGCNLDEINNENCINLQALKRLSLHDVYIEEETFEKIMSSCPSIQHLILRPCRGLSTIKLNKAPNLKHFDFHLSRDCEKSSYSIEINDDAPSLETMRILLDNDNYIFPRLKSIYLRALKSFPHLKSLNLQRVHVTTESLNNLLSNNCPCLGELQLRHCSVFNEFKILNCFIKRLMINNTSDPPTTWKEWKSHVQMGGPDSNADDLSTWLLQLKEFLNALSQSQISLEVSSFPETNQDTFDGGGSCEPVVVEHLLLGSIYFCFAIPGLLNCLFRICRPRYIGRPSFPLKIYKTSLTKCLWKILVDKLETRQCEFWKRDLEETSVQVMDEKTKEWRSVQACALPNDENIRFRLKWRDLS